MSNLARQAWDAYAHAVGGKTFDGKPLPNWYDLGERQRSGWQAAADVVEQAVTNKLAHETIPNEDDKQG